LVGEPVCEDDRVQPLLIMLAAALRPRRSVFGTKWRRLDAGRQALLVVGGAALGVARVRVDQMAEGEASALLTAGLPALPPERVADALRATGRWPVLLALVHGAVGDGVREGGDPAGELAEVLAALAVEGITALDAAHPDERGMAVAATIEVSC
jgi:hypothetical protein